MKNIHMLTLFSIATLFFIIQSNPIYATNTEEESIFETNNSPRDEEISLQQSENIFNTTDNLNTPDTDSDKHSDSDAWWNNTVTPPYEETYDPFDDVEKSPTTPNINDENDDMFRKKDSEKPVDEESIFDEQESIFDN